MNDNFYIEQLRSLLIKSFEPEVLNSYSSSILSEKIFDTTKKRVSASTLQRLMGFTTSKSSISITSLTILVNYLGFKSWVEFKANFKTEQINQNQENITDYYGLKLLDIACKNHNFSTVLEYISLLPLENYSVERQLIGETLGQVIRYDKKARQILLPELAKTPQGRFYFYENFVDLDFLSHYYADSLDFYKKHITQQDKKSSLRDAIFATSIQFLNQLQLRNKVEAIKTGYELKRITKKQEINIESVGHILPLTRYKTTMMSYWFLSNQPYNYKCESYLEELELELSSCDPFTRTFILAETFRALDVGKRYIDIKYLFDKYTSYPITKVVEGQYQLVLLLAEKSYNILGENFIFDYNKVSNPKRIMKDFTKISFE